MVFLDFQLQKLLGITNNINGVVMSVDDWVKEAMPVKATDCKKKDALDHSLKKWKMLTNENLKKYNLKVYNGNLYKNDELVLTLDQNHCALCVWYFDEDKKNSGESCNKCPLFKVNDRPCWNEYRFFRDTLDADPQLMIRLIESAIKLKK
jgi:hypothetical protein